MLHWGIHSKRSDISSFGHWDALFYQCEFSRPPN
uniref:Uncharacterized protein n=1 Tax=Anguilla anguilla TaxID=7936 RepID=A0A0E9RGV5_ANGAN